MVDVGEKPKEIIGFVEMYCGGCGKKTEHEVVIVKDDEGTFLDLYRKCPCGNITNREEFYLWKQ